ncbi:unnamed protein product [Urochloa decumbens]|uniref:RING-type domain-containing protein n=1 Tax=Urochloa decumbens TaxID=240449 RepID=A0ABC9GTJ5_9POAL
MEQQPHPTGVQRADCHVLVRIELQVHQVNGDAGSHGNVKDVEPRLTRESTAAANSGVNTTSHENASDHVVDVAPHEADHDTNNCCIVCTEPSEWVCIGRCGHRVVCRKCMVRIRFFHRNKRCCICRTRCPKVIVAKRGARAGILSTLPLDRDPVQYCTCSGGHCTRACRAVGPTCQRPPLQVQLTAAYYEDEQEYSAARAACEGILSPFFQPLCGLLVIFSWFLGYGVIVGTACTVQFKHSSAQVTAYVVSISVAMLIGTIIWSAIKCNQDPLEQERNRREEKQ